MQSTAADSPIIPDALAALPAWQQMLIIIGIALTAAGVVRLVGPMLLNWGTEDTEAIPEILFDVLATPIYLSLLLGGIYVSLLLVELPVFGFYLMATTLTLLVFIWTWATVQLGRRIINWMGEDVPGSDVAPILGNVWTLLVGLVASYITFDIWQVNLAPLLVSASVIGIVVGLAAQDAVANFVGGIALFADDTYKPGDFVVLDTGEKGTVVDIGLRATTIVTLDRVEVVIPNAVMNSTLVINESGPKQHKRIHIPIGVSYDTDFDHVESVLQGIMESEDEILDTPQPWVYFREFDDSAIILELRGYISHPAREAPVRHLLNRQIHRRLTEEEIQIPYPRRTLSFKDDLEESNLIESLS